MKKLTVPVLDDKDKEFVEMLVNVGCRETYLRR